MTRPTERAHRANRGSLSKEFVFIREPCAFAGGPSSVLRVTVLRQEAGVCGAEVNVAVLDIQRIRRASAATLASCRQ